MAKTEAMTQRGELAAVVDRLAVDALVTEYAVTVDDSDWAGYPQLFTPDGRADHSAVGGIAADATRTAEWLADDLRRHPVRQLLLVNRRLRFTRWEQDLGDTAQVQADYLSSLRPAPPDGAASAPGLDSGGRYEFALLRTEDGWRFRGLLVQEKWRKSG